MAELVYRARSDYVAAQAVIKLLQLARSTASEFSFSPSSVPEILQQGLSLSGDTDEAAQALDAIAGLVQQA